MPGDDYGPLFMIAGVRVGVSICEDAWSPDGPIAHQAAGGGGARGEPQRIALLHAGRLHERETMLEESVPPTHPSRLSTANLVGGQDELVAFDGGSLVIDEQGGSSRARSSSRKIC